MIYQHLPPIISRKEKHIGQEKYIYFKHWSELTSLEKLPIDNVW